jgi:hypothetical protein
MLDWIEDDSCVKDGTHMVPDFIAKTEGATLTVRDFPSGAQFAIEPGGITIVSDSANKFPCVVDAQEAAEAALAHWRDGVRLREWLTVFSTMTPDRFKPEHALDALNGGWVDV